MDKSARTSTLLIPQSPGREIEDVGNKPEIGIRTNEEALQIEMELEEVIFVGGQEPSEKDSGPSAEMMEWLSSDHDIPIKREQEVVQKLSEEQVKEAITAIPVDN